MTKCVLVYQMLMAIVWLRLVSTLARVTLVVHLSVTSVGQATLTSATLTASKLLVSS